METKKNVPHPMDVYVGARLCAARRAKGWSQKYIGSLLSDTVTFQQIQKYERGINRVSASMLYEFATALEVSVTYFFPEGMTQEAPLLDRAESAMLHDWRLLPNDTRKALQNLIAELKR